MKMKMKNPPLFFFFIFFCVRALLAYSPTGLCHSTHIPSMEVVRHSPFQFTSKSDIFTTTFHSNISFNFRISRSNCCCYRRKNFKVSAHFVGKATTRPNYLRKKLISKDPTLLLRSNFQSSSPRKGESSKSRDNCDDEEATALVVDELKQKPLPLGLGGGELGEKLGSWVDQYNKDVQLWGLGSGAIFNIVVDSNGNVKQVEVNEDEIHNRTHLDSEALAAESNSKVLLAQRLAREMELGDYSVIPRNSSVAKYIVQESSSSSSSRFVDSIRDLHLIHPKLNIGVGFGAMLVLFGFVLVRAITNKRKETQEITEFEKEMIRRKMKSRQQKVVSEKKVQIEVVETSFDNEEKEEQELDISRPKLNKDTVLDIIRRTKSSGLQPQSSTYEDAVHITPQEVGEIWGKETSKSAGVIMEGDEGEECFSPGNEQSAFSKNGENEPINGITNDTHVNHQLVPKVSDAGVMMEGDEGEECFSTGNEQSAFSQNGENEPINGTNNATHANNQLVPKVSDAGVMMEGDEAEECFSPGNEQSAFPTNGENEPINGTTNATHVNHQLVPKVSDAADSKIEASPSSASNLKASDNMQQRSEQDICNEAAPTSVGRKQRKIIRSVEEARKYLSSKRSSKTNLQSVSSLQENGDSGKESSNELVTSDLFAADTEGLTTAQMSETVSTTVTAQSQKIDGVSDDEESSSGKTKNWIQENYGEVEPVAEKIAAGFRDNYMAAKEKVVNKDSSSSVVATEKSQLQFPEDGSEFEWMKDDRLREIVFQVRENELMGRDPFYSMDAEDKCAFFEGLEKKVVQENEKLLHLHEYLHSNIENLDYGADGISVYDPPEKFVPRWKGPTMEKDPEFLRSYREAFLDKKAAYPVDKDDNLIRNIVQESSSSEIKLKNSSVVDFEKSKIVIESSDGSVKAGKKSGKEFWQHTKKWSRGFLESYNAESDPEVKSAMKEIGKDLDRWITDKEIEEAADLINKLPSRKKKFIEKKLDKVKREMELFGPQAVVSKYSEYAEVDEEDYLWWLDLPHVLCIELYVTEDGEQKVGFYTVEMAQDLELDPKPHHVIAFEDPHDCKELCYIIQAHMEMLGNGHAFVVPRPPKDAYREAKANGFGVTVIRKGEVKLNIDKTLEEVEEEISEIGSKVYQDKIIKESSADISGLMKGVFGFSGKPSTKKRRPRQKKLKKPSKKPSKKTR